MTFILPGGLGQLGAPSLSGWDVTVQGYGSGSPGFFAASSPELAAAVQSDDVPYEVRLDLGPAPLAVGPITENFPTVENPLSTGGQWRHQTTYWANMAVGSFNLPAPTHVCYGLQDGTNVYGDAYAYLSPTVWPPSFTDVTVAYTVNRNSVLGPGGDTDEFEAVFRVHDSPSPTGVGTVTLYEVNYHIDGAYLQFVAWDGTPGTFTILGNAGTVPALVTGDVISVTMQGLTITAKRNGTTLYTATDPGTGSGDPNYTGPFNTGQPGFAKFYQAPPTGPDHYGFTQVVVTSAPYTAPIITDARPITFNVFRTIPSGTVIGQINATHNPTSWAISAPSPAGTDVYFTIDAFANVVLTPTGAGNLSASSYTFTATATNSFGSTLALVVINVSGAGAVLTNNNRTVIDSGDNINPIAIRGKKSIPTTGATASRRRYIEFQAGNVGDTGGPGTRTTWVSVGMADATWNPVTDTLPLGADAAGNGIGVRASSLWVLEFGGSGLFVFPFTPAIGDIVGIAVDTSAVNFAGTAFWFNLNGQWLNKGSGVTPTFPGLTNADAVLGLIVAWPACSTDFFTHVTINPAGTQLYRPTGFLAWG